jgi:acetyl esterase/lipase
MRVLPRRVRRPVVGVVTAVLVVVVGSSVLLVPPVLADALGGSSAHAVAGLAPLGSGKTTLTYCANGGVAETLDVYEPTPLPSSPVPVVVYVHGGGWVEGDSTITPGSLVAQVASAIEAKGWVFVSIDYRLAPKFRWPDQIEDASCAIRFLRAKSSALHIDPGAIGAMGDSAGGQIVSLLGLAGSSAGFDGGRYADESSSVQAVADLYGPADLTTTDWIDDPFIQAYAPQAFGTKFGPGPAGSASTKALVAASPDSYIGPDAPPFLIVQGAEDSVVPPDQSMGLDYRLRAAGDSATLVMVEHAQHGLLSVAGGTMTPSVSQVAAQTAAFLIKHLQPSASHPTGTHRAARR